MQLCNFLRLMGISIHAQESILSVSLISLGTRFLVGLNVSVLRHSGHKSTRRNCQVLELRPNCECCDRDLPPESTEARICSFECTFCAMWSKQNLVAFVPTVVVSLCHDPVGRRPSSQRTDRHVCVCLSHVVVLKRLNPSLQLTSQRRSSNDHIRNCDNYDMPCGPWHGSYAALS